MILDALTVTRRRVGGFALLMVLMLIAAASVVGISYIYGTQVKTASTGNLMLASKARYLAESGLQHGLCALQTGALPLGSAAAPNGPYHIDAGDGGYVFHITPTPTPNDYKIVATGTEGGISQTVAMTVRLTSDYAQKMIDDIAPTYWWRLGDSGLTAVDARGLHNGTYVNGVTREVDGALLGDVDTAAEFNGNNDYVNLGEIGDLSGARLTFGCWARADGWADSNPRLISRSSGTDIYERRWQLSCTDARKLRFDLKLKNTLTTVTGDTPVQLGQWFFVVCVYNRDTHRMRIYLNGELDGTLENVLNEDINDAANVEVWIGDCPYIPGQRQWSGAVDEAFIMKNRALTPTKIRELFDARIPKTEVISWDD